MQICKQRLKVACSMHIFLAEVITGMLQKCHFVPVMTFSILCQINGRNCHRYYYWY